MNKPLRVGLIGAGMGSHHHLIAWTELADQARVVAVAVEDCYLLSGWEDR
jgi:predicted dehydrogenase